MRVHHFGFLAADGKATVQEYLSLGARVEQDEKYDPFRKIKITFIVIDGYRLEIIEPTDKDSPFYPLLKRYKNSPYHTCYEVDDLNGSICEFQSRGWMITSMPEEAPCIDNKKVTFLMSHNMGIVELVEI